MVTRCEVKVIVHSSFWVLGLGVSLTSKGGRRTDKTDCQTEVRAMKSIMIFDGADHYSKQPGPPQETELIKEIRSGNASNGN